MKCLVTGSTGFVGKPLSAALVARKFDLVQAVRCRVNGMEGDVLEVGSIDGGTDWSAGLVGVDVVYHLAARVHVMREKEADPGRLFRTINTEATISLAEQAAAAGVSRFVFISSIKVNGDGAEIEYTPDSQPQPVGDYAVSKFEAEKALLKIAKRTGMTVVIARPPLIYGPGVKGNFASLLRLVEVGVPLPLGSICNNRSLLFVGNLVSWLVAVAEAPEVATGIYMPADLEAVSTPGLVRRIAAALGKPAWLLPFPVTLLRLLARILGKGDVIDRLAGSLTVDTAGARSISGWEPLFSLDDGIRLTAEWYLDERSDRG